MKEKKLKKKSQVPQVVLVVFMSLMSVSFLLPFLLLVSISISNEKRIVFEGFSLIPRGFDLSAYRYIFKDPSEILQAYKVTAEFSFLSMVLSVFLMSLIAYALSRRQFRGKQFISFFLFFTMLFSGGLVPSYILITQYLHLNNTIWVYIIPSLISPWSIFMIRAFFQAIPYEISESAIIDGANDYVIYSRIVFPLSKPVLATVALTTFLGKWNDWYTSMLYIDSKKLRSLQYLLQQIMMRIQLIQQMPQAASMIGNSIPSETVRMAMAVVVAGPALLVFPFFQKYFVKGITLGSVKG